MSILREEDAEVFCRLDIPVRYLRAKTGVVDPSDYKMMGETLSVPGYLGTYMVRLFIFSQSGKMR